MATVFTASLSLVAVVPATHVHAEGTHQVNEMQSLSSDTAVYVDILNAGETINISLCESGTLRIYDTEGTPADLNDDTLVEEDTEYMGNLACGSPLPNPITTAFKFTPASTGTYRIEVPGGENARYDFSVTANNTINPNPTQSNGRVWSYEWQLETGSFSEAAATDMDLYALVPAPVNGEHFVWKLDLNKFSGNSYDIKANNIGLNAPYSGISADRSDSQMEPLYPIYLSYPDIAGASNSTNPLITNLGFLDDDGEDDTFSPGSTNGVQDTGIFTFTSNVSNATYAITVDTNKDGVYGGGDRLLLGAAQTGVNNVTWDGNYANGNPVPDGHYNARVQLRIGEFHFVAGDVETSGGTHNGLTIYKATGQNTVENTTVYWDDTQLMQEVYDADADDYVQVPAVGATSNLPNGVTSGSTADANNDGKADGFHTWGDFTGDTMGDGNNLDTYVYGAADVKYTTLAVASVDGTDDDGVSSGIEHQALNSGDGNGDGTPDHLQTNVASLPNSVTGEYSTLEVQGCSNLSNVAIRGEADLSSADNQYEYPVGLFDFEVNCLAPGATASVKVFYDKVYDTQNWQARKFINGTYSNITGATFGTATVGGTQVTTLSYSVTDGGPLDEDGASNGVIVDPVGPGIGGGATTVSAAVSAPNTGLERVSVTAPLVTIAVGTGILVAFSWYVRRYEENR